MKARAVFGIFCAAALWTVPASASGTLDSGLLEPAWFGAGEVEFRKAGSVDYLWVAEGFSIDGKTLHFVEWEQPQFLDKGRDSKDSARAYELSDNMPTWLRGGLATALGDGTGLSREAGEIRVEGRFVDVNAGSKVAKWMIGAGAGSAAATWDIRLVDAATGETLAAIHHRSISGTSMSDIDDKILKWIDKDLGPAMRNGLRATYDQGKRAKK
jgi:hypothetical protein